MKVLHLTVVRQLITGQRRQLEYERIAARSLTRVEWTTLAFHGDQPRSDGERRLPRGFRNPVLLSAYAWFVLLRVSRKYDVVLYRHLMFDPFGPFLSWAVRNRVSVHHAMEEAELPLVKPGWKGKLAALVERASKAITSRTLMGVLGVTREIADYEVDRNPAIGRSFVYPNGIVAAEHSTDPTPRSRGELTVLFACGTFSRWHGLDLLLKAVSEDSGRGVPDGQSLNILLAGRLSGEQMQMVRSIEASRVKVVALGHVKHSDFLTLLDECDLGLGSFALFRKGLTEGATLKVREYLAAGVPVYSGHRDTALPDTFPFYLTEPDGPSVTSLARMALMAKSVPRSEVREAALPYLDKSRIMAAVAKWLVST